MIDFLTTDELRAHRREHMANLQRLRDVMPSLNPITTARAETTMDNLTAQVLVIDDELAMADKGMRGAA